MTYDPFFCDECWGETRHLDHCPVAPEEASPLPVPQPIREDQ